MAFSNLVNNLPQMLKYEVRMLSGQLIVEDIDDLSVLRDIIHNYGLQSIDTITFFLHNLMHSNYYVILRNTHNNDRFMTEFFHYYDKNYNKVNISEKEAERDYVAVMRQINNTSGLEGVHKYILGPYSKVYDLV
jgi:hypothetical protein